MKFNYFHAKRAEELVRRPAHTPDFSAQRKDFVQILKDFSLAERLPSKKVRRRRTQ